MIVREALIPTEHHGQRLDVVLATLFPDFSRSQLSQWLKDGLITIDQQQRRPKDKALGGEYIELQVPQSPLHAECEAEAIPLDVVFEDEHLLVVNKPAGLIVHPGAGNPKHTLVNGLLHHAPILHSMPRAGIVHRLDKDTTGLLIVAKTPEAHTHLVRQLQAREITRHYLALVYGYIVAGGHIDTFYGRHPHHRLKMAVCTHGRQAITHYSVHQRYTHFTLLDISLLTGRTHQIRVHMAHINHPVVGDPLYAGRSHMPAGVDPLIREHLQHFKRQALHARTLSFIHPQSLQQLTLIAPLPDDFQLLLNLLDNHSDASLC